MCGGFIPAYGESKNETVSFMDFQLHKLGINCQIDMQRGGLNSCPPTKLLCHHVKQPAFLNAQTC